MESGPVKIVGKVTWGVALRWSQRYSVEPGNHFLGTNTAQLRTLTSCGIFGGVSDNNVTVLQSITVQLLY